MMRAIVLTPQVSGADGVSAVARQVVGALRTEVGRSLASLDVWSLHDECAPRDLDRGVAYRAARGSRVVFASFGVRERHVTAGTLVLVLHAHLLPVTLPLIRRGARIVPLLLGIEAWKPLNRLERAALERAWKVAAISQHTIDRFRAANPRLGRIPITVCHPAVPNRRTGEATNRRSHEPTNPFALIVGRMSSGERYKGHDELLDIWGSVLAAVPGARLVIAGSGDDEARLSAKAKALGLDGAVRFEGQVDDARLAALYRDAACFVMPSRDEGFGLVFLEAMQAGTPCLAARGAAEEIIEHGVSGLIVDAGHSAMLGAAIVRLMTDGRLRDVLGRAAARRVAERFEPAHFAERLLHLLDLAPTTVAC